ncbi:unnamed protein product, partial [Acidithrix sp. C25]
VDFLFYHNGSVNQPREQDGFSAPSSHGFLWSRRMNVT